MARDATGVSDAKVTNTGMEVQSSHLAALSAQGGMGTEVARNMSSLEDNRLLGVGSRSVHVQVKYMDLKHLPIVRKRPRANEDGAQLPNKKVRTET